MIYTKEPAFKFVVGDASFVAEFEVLYGSPLRVKARKQKMRAVMTGWMQDGRIQGKMAIHSLN